MKLNWISQGTKSFFLIGGVAIAGLMVSARIYERELTRLDTIEKEAILTTHLAEMSHSYYLLHRLHSANKEVASQILSLDLIGDIKQVRAAAGGLEASQQAFAERLCDNVLFDEQHHPDYYLAGDAKTRSSEALIWKALEDEAIASSHASGSELLKMPQDHTKSN